MYLVMRINRIENKNVFLLLLIIIRSPKQCGCWVNDTKVQFTEKIIGGFESIPHSWPWIVSIRKRLTSKPFGVHICGD
jgi:hypothetical protein